MEFEVRGEIYSHFPHHYLLSHFQLLISAMLWYIDASDVDAGEVGDDGED